jgi:hypothetical protein
VLISGHPGFGTSKARTIAPRTVTHGSLRLTACVIVVWLLALAASGCGSGGSNSRLHRANVQYMEQNGIGPKTAACVVNQMNAHGFSDARLNYDINHAETLSESEDNSLQSVMDGQASNACLGVLGQ